MRDFTLEIFRSLLAAINSQGYTFMTFKDYQAYKLSMLNIPHRGGQSSIDDNSDGSGQGLNEKSEIAENQAPGAQLIEQRVEQLGGTGKKEFGNSAANHPSPITHRHCILRHDVDLLPENSLTTAKIENELGIKGSYYFRMIPAVYNESIIKDIASLGHEIGYHYEEMDLASRQWALGSGQTKNKSSKKNIAAMHSYNNAALIDSAYELFKINLEKLRSIVPVTTICMHGSPLSKFDNKEIWYKYDYKELGIIGEPYFDIDWNEFGYLTDTGRRWDGSSVAVRDKVSRQLAVGSSQQKKYVHSSMLNIEYRSTGDIIKAIEQNIFPMKVMINVHPQRWTDSYTAWGKELVLQNIKNIVKRIIVINDVPIKSGCR